MADEGSVSVCVDPGACRFRSRITAHYDGNGVKLEITSDCPHVKQLAQRISDLELQPFEALKMPWTENIVFIESGKYLKHATCPLPLAMLKCMEAATGLAVKKDISIKFDRQPC
jgi:hypothetical protein